jgi:hypothetical protein
MMDWAGSSDGEQDMYTKFRSRDILENYLLQIRAAGRSTVVKDALYKQGLNWNTTKCRTQDLLERR